MEAATSADAPRKLEGEKAQRIIAAMRASVGTRGAAGSTFDHVAREAGVSRGLLHYYFGSKERLLVEVVRHDCDARIAAHGRAARAGADASTRSSTRSSSALEDFIEDDAGEPGRDLRDAERLAPHRGDPRGAGRALPPLARAASPSALRTKEREGVSASQAEPEAVASILFALGDGFGIQVLSDPDWDSRPRFDLGARAPRAACSAPRDPRHRSHARTRILGWLATWEEHAGGDGQARRRSSSAAAGSCSSPGSSCCSPPLPFAAKQTDHLTSGGFEVPGLGSRRPSTANLDRFDGAQRDQLAVVLARKPGADAAAVRAEVDRVGRDRGASSRTSS